MDEGEPKTDDDDAAATPEPAAAAVPAASEAASLVASAVAQSAFRSAPLVCAACRNEVGLEYWMHGAQHFCSACTDGVTKSIAAARSGGTFARSFLVGGGVALACGVGYAIVAALTHFQLALITIGIGWAVGHTVRRVTRGFGTRRHQVLAVALTYFASTMGYAPGVVAALQDGAQQHASHDDGGVTASGDGDATASAGPAHDAPAPHVGAGRAVLALVLLAVLVVAFALVSPIFDVTSGIGGVIGLAIIAFGLRTAWRASSGVAVRFEGPYRHAAAEASG